MFAVPFSLGQSKQAGRIGAHVAYTGNMINAYDKVTGKPKVKTPFGIIWTYDRTIVLLE
jgi:hypothetical protein